MAWPTTLPDPLMSGYSVQAGDCTVRTDMDSGAARVRRRFTAAPDRVDLKWLLTDAQMAIFRTAYESEFQSGAAWVFLTIRNARTAGLVSKECRPTGPFKSDLISPAYWLVEMPVEVRNA